MKFHKRPMDDRETASAMSQVPVDCARNCTGRKCICPSIPTHLNLGLYKQRKVIWPN